MAKNVGERTRRATRRARAASTKLTMPLGHSRLSRVVTQCAVAGLVLTSAFGGFQSADLPNFQKVDDHVYRGAQPTDEGFKDLARLGIKTVIDLRMDVDAQESGLVGKAGMQYVRIPMTTHTPPTASQQSQFLSLVNDPARQPVYVHCKEGRHRTGVMTALYRMTQDRWTSDQAFKEMKQYDFGWDFLHSEFKRFVYSYVAPVEGGSSFGVVGAPRATN